jgi:hypothetical protein
VELVYSQTRVFAPHQVFTVDPLAKIQFVMVEHRMTLEMSVLDMETVVLPIHARALHQVGMEHNVDPLFVLESFQMIPLYVLGVDHAFFQMFAQTVPMVMLETNVNIQFVMDSLPIRQMYVVQEELVFCQIFALALQDGLGQCVNSQSVMVKQRMTAAFALILEVLVLLRMCVQVAQQDTEVHNVISQFVMVNCQMTLRMCVQDMEHVFYLMSVVHV